MIDEKKTEKERDQSWFIRIQVAVLFLLSSVCFLFSFFINIKFPQYKSWADIFFTLGIEFVPLGIFAVVLAFLQNKSGEEGIINSMEKSMNDNLIPALQGTMGNVLKDYGFTKKAMRTVGYREMYTIGTNIIMNAKKRLLIIQQTSSLLFGPRIGEKDEADFYSEFNKWIDNLEKTFEENSELECYHLFSLNNTKNAIKEKDVKISYTKEDIRMNIIKYKNLEKKTNGRFRLAVVTSSFSGPIAIGDNSFAIWIGGWENNPTSISFEQIDFADQLMEICKGMIGRQPDLEELLNKLEL